MNWAKKPTIGVIFGCFGRKIDSPGLPGGLIIYQGHLFLLHVFWGAQTEAPHLVLVKEIRGTDHIPLFPNARIMLGIRLRGESRF